MTSDELSAIYKAYGGMVERQALRVCRNVHMAQDVAQEVFVRFIRYSANNQVYDVTGLLHQMATQGAIKKIRAHGTVPIQDRIDTVPASPGYDTDAWIAFQKALNSVDETYAQIAVHYFVDGMSQAEIADAMQMERRTVGRHLERFCAKARRVAGVNRSADMDDEAEPQTSRSMRETR